jgi:hypothetical protein
MIDLFETPKVNLTKLTNHSGGAEGSDTYWEKIGEEFGVKTNAYSYKTKYHQSPNKVEISDEDYEDGVKEIKRANIILNRYKIDKFMNLLARNWAQVKYSNQVFAIGQIVNPGQKGSRGYASRAKYQSVDGGTGWAISMSIQNKKDIYVYDQIKLKWFRWSYLSMSFIELEETPKIKTQNFAGIGTRQINSSGIKAIKDVYLKTFNVLT